MARPSVLLAFVVGVTLAVAVCATTYIKEDFDEGWRQRWIDSDWKKADGTQGKWNHTGGRWAGDEHDRGLQTGQDNRFYTATAKLATPFPGGRDLVLQYSVKHEQKWIECGGGYIKLYPGGIDQAHLRNTAQTTLTFGPDLCGTQTKHVVVSLFDTAGKAHGISTSKQTRAETNKLTHFYTLILRADGTYEVRIDNQRRESGNIAEDFSIPSDTKLLLNERPIEYVGFELWQVRAGTIFDNILVTDSVEEAEAAVRRFEQNRRTVETTAWESFDRVQQAEEERVRKGVEAERARQDEELANRMAERVAVEIPGQQQQQQRAPATATPTPTPTPTPPVASAQGAATTQGAARSTGTKKGNKAAAARNDDNL